MIDIDRQIDAVHRRVTAARAKAAARPAPSPSTRPTTPPSTTCGTPAPTPADPRWFLPVTGDLRLGGTYQLEGNAGGTIEECEPPTRFRVTWEFGGGVSWVEVRLLAEGDDRTRLQLAHTAPVDDHWSEFGPGAVGVGWDLALVGLQLHLASGEPVDPRRVEAWTQSADGVRFLTSAARRGATPTSKPAPPPPRRARLPPARRPPTPREPPRADRDRCARQLPATRAVCVRRRATGPRPPGPWW